ncbi:rhomboid family intramembrane serine protease [uncultured Rhodoblastus sp.]|uniref:rhomboid family intramembrane serine protease n=1 Tax=uncultured Rhodoblastus sp. TaxID=543037 RepID=UPI0025FE47FB|nr:rhomboid family intramembrane serine protease [uncultured Rhodoblastus sp.]
MRDSRREPIFNIPAVVLALLASMTFIHIGRLLTSPETDLRLLATFGFVPARFGFLLDQRAVLEHLTKIANASEFEGQLGEFFLTFAPPSKLWFTPLSYAFLHGDWTHLIFNGVWLAAFGSPVARRFGVSRFLLLGALGAVIGAFFFLAFHIAELAPMIGASAAVSGYMGAASRFVFQPGAFFRSPISVAGEPPLASLPELMANRQTLAFVGFWFVSNLLIGLGGPGFGLSSGPIAWEAHIGGFMAGLLLAPLFDQRRNA